MEKVTKIKELITLPTIEWLENPNTTMEYFRDEYTLRSKLIQLPDIEHNKYILIGRIKVDLLTYGQTYDKHIYLIMDDDNIYVSLDFCHPIYWYTISDIGNINNIISDIVNCYNGTNNLLTKTLSMVIGTEGLLKMSIDEIENDILSNFYTDILLWGPKWDDFPFRQRYNSGFVSKEEHVIYSTRAMEQVDDLYTFNTRSIYSNSIITFQKGIDYYYVKIQYTPTIYTNNVNCNNFLGRNYPSDMPMDAIIALSTYPCITSEYLLGAENIQYENIRLARLLMTPDNIKNVNNKLIEIVSMPGIDGELKNYIMDVRLDLSLEIAINEQLHNETLVEYVRKIITSGVNISDVYKTIESDLIRKLKVEIDKLMLIKINKLVKESIYVINPSIDIPDNLAIRIKKKKKTRKTNNKVANIANNQVNIAKN